MFPVADHNFTITRPLQRLHVSENYSLHPDIDTAYMCIHAFVFLFQNKYPQSHGFTKEVPQKAYEVQ